MMIMIVMMTSGMIRDTYSLTINERGGMRGRPELGDESKKTTRIGQII